jgi:hypothetical protein
VQEETMKMSKVLVVALLLLSASTLSAQSKPNFSGEWTLVPAKSDFGMMPPPSSSVQKVTHNEPQLKVVNTQTGDQGTNTTESSYTTDGKECVNKGFMDSEMKSTAKWDGDTLVIDSKMDIQGNAITMSNRWSLSGDGKNLTVAMHFTSPMGEGDVKMVYEKK